MKREFVFLLLTRGVSGLASAFASVLLARSIGPQLFGVFGTVVSTSTTIMTFAGLGLPTLIAKQRATRSSLLGETLRLNSRSLLIGSVIGVSAAIVISRQSWSTLPALFVIVLALSLESYADSLLSVAIADGARWATSINILVRRLVLVGAVTVAIVLGMDGLLFYAIGYFLGCLFAVLLGRRYCKKRGVVSVKVERYRERLSDAWPYALSNGAAATRSLDTMIVSATAGSLGAGNYAAASRLTAPFYLIPTALTQVLMPHAAKADRRAVKRIGFRLSVVAFVSYIAVIPFVLFSHEAVLLLLGSEYSSAESVFIWTLVAMPVVALSSPLGTLLQSQDCERFVGLNGLSFALAGLVGMVFAGVLVGTGTAVAVVVFITYFLKCLSLILKIARLDDEAILPAKPV